MNDHSGHELTLGLDGTLRWADRPVEETNVQVTGEFILRVRVDAGLPLPVTLEIPTSGHVAVFNPNDYSNGDTAQYIADARDAGIRWRDELAGEFPIDMVTALLVETSALAWQAQGIRHDAELPGHG